MEDFENGFESRIENLKGIRRDLGGLELTIDKETLDVIISTRYGWKVIYPPTCEAWMHLAMWAEKWDEQSKDTVENFVKLLVYPTATRLSDIDLQYIHDIVLAHSSLNDRIVKSADPPTEASEEKDLLHVADIRENASCLLKIAEGK